MRSTGRCEVDEKAREKSESAGRSLENTDV